MRVKITDYLNKRRGDDIAYLNFSIPKHRQQRVTDGLAFLMHKLLPRSKSSVVCDGIILYAWVVREGLLSDEQIRSILDQG